MVSCQAKIEKNNDVIEEIKKRDLTVIYAESIDDENAILYRSIYPNVLFYVKKDLLSFIASIILTPNIFLSLKLLLHPL